MKEKALMFQQLQNQQNNMLLQMLRANLLNNNNQIN